MMAHSLSDMENYFSELEDFITLSDNDKVHLFHSSMLEILILKVNFIIRSTQYSQNLNKVYGSNTNRNLVKNEFFSAIGLIKMVNLFILKLKK